MNMKMPERRNRDGNRLDWDRGGLSHQSIAAPTMKRNSLKALDIVRSLRRGSEDLDTDRRSTCRYRFSPNTACGVVAEQQDEGCDSILEHTSNAGKGEDNEA
jgi:hypothetical protein